MDERSVFLRKLILRGLKGGNRGHLGSSFSMVEIFRVLYDDILNFDPKNPKWELRDRCILSKGHGCLTLYALLADKGFFPIEELDKFCRKDGVLGGHPSHKVSGIECDTGALGHGLSIGIGMALAAKIRKKNHRIFVIMGDGEINEGSVWEAAMSSSKYRLDNLIAIIDRNQIQSAGLTENIQPMEPLMEKWRAFGFATYECDGHNIEILKKEFTQKFPGKPLCIIANTIKGRGILIAENNPNYHHKANITEAELLEWEKALEAA